MESPFPIGCTSSMALGRYAKSLLEVSKLALFKLRMPLSFLEKPKTSVLNCEARPMRFGVAGVHRGVCDGSQLHPLHIDAGVSMRDMW